MMKLSLLFASIICLHVVTIASEEVIVETQQVQQTQVTQPVLSVQQPAQPAQKAAVDSEATVLTVNKPEDQIPLTIDQTKKVADTQPMSTRLLMTGVIIAGLLGTAYYFVRKYKFSNTINKSNMQIKVLSQHYLGPKKSLAIIRVAGESILIGVTDANISMIKSLSLLDEDMPQEAPQDFATAMTIEDKRTTAAQPAAGATASSSTKAAMNMDELEEEFSFSGLKDSVSKKLKSMRSI